ncbi:TetR/AcrR family transcriptional regulator [Aquipuribacter nitratireducens]|uniref:TetR/AcrR family transcriptional regulator n=1 Tax=Aquipuribacter nitratireducens TaxID=650104 RepID=A0ABW0GS39_9MICO
MVTTHTDPVRGSWRGVRPSQEEIDAAIVDTAAEVFARHGFAGTSVQQVADAVGYSKTGLLRRVTSKQALYDAVIDHVEAYVVDLGGGGTTPTGDAGRRAFLRRVATVAFAHPGVVLLVLEALRTPAEFPRSDRLHELATQLLDDVVAELDAPEDRLRAVLALQLVANAALLPLDPNAPLGDLAAAEVHDVAVESALAVLAPARS